MSEMPSGLPRHPIGTFAFVGAYAALFVLAWFGIYHLHLPRSSAGDAMNVDPYERIWMW